MVKPPSQVREDWYQDAAKAQIQTEQMTRAEMLNGRLAMLGFLIGLLTELFTGQGIVGQLCSGLSL
tara:strand:- start:887 stop:1084 length:198 start_codon:yes stop_codon:yes gene_type:complete